MFNNIAFFNSPVLRRTITIDSATPVFEWNLEEDGFSGAIPANKLIVTLIITEDTNVVSSVFGTPAIDLTGLPAGSTILLTNNGAVYGHGGAGGSGGDAYAQYEPGTCLGIDQSGTSGLAGGDAIQYDGDGVNLTITNNGLIFGGGGGGGGGGACMPGSSTPSGSCYGSGGGGGGGGSGGVLTGGLTGAAGAGGTSYQFFVEQPPYAGANGSAGDPGPTGGGGSGGSGGTGYCSSGNGGAGGDFGEAGSSGGSGTSSGGSGGTAGLAINNIESVGTPGSASFVVGGVDGVDVKGTVE